MEILRIVGGLGAIAVIVALVGLSRGEDGAAAKPPERGFASETSTARFVSAGE